MVEESDPRKTIAPGENRENSLALKSVFDPVEGRWIFVSEHARVKENQIRE